MGNKSAEAGKSPFVSVGSCAGALEVRGSDRSDVRVDSGDEIGELILEGNSVRVPALTGSGTIRLPHDGRLRLEGVGSSLLVKYLKGTIESAAEIGGSAVIRHCGEVTLTVVGGSAHLKYLDGAARIDQVGGAVRAKYLNDLLLGEVGGEVRAAYVDGALAAGSVGGSVVLRQVNGAVEVPEIGGNFSARTITGNIILEAVRGNLSLRTRFAADNEYRMTVYGGTMIRIDDTPGVTFVLPANAEPQVDGDMEITTEEGAVIVRAGNGSARVQLSTYGPVRLSRRGDYDVDLDVDIEIDDAISEQLGDFSAQMDAGFRKISETMQGVVFSDSVRQRIERKLSAARQKIEEAQRRVEDAVSNAGEDITIRYDKDYRTPPREPVSEEERMMILQMLEDGRITVDEASELLSALEG
jgi:hypothetical protein